ncbi:MAG: hypothetical protein GQ532_08375, partial [Methylomarinum sp.]|nr:hypothetical protein [Methylomarinum sp.]
GKISEQVNHGEDTTFVLHYKASTILQDAIFGLGIHTNDFLYLADKDTEDDGLITKEIKTGEFKVFCKIRNFPLLQGVYSLRVGVAVGPIYRMSYYAEGIHPFEVKGNHKTRPQGFVALNTNWTVLESNE